MMKQLTQLQINNLPEWLPISDYPDYEVNPREGQVKSLTRKKVLSPGKYDKCYLFVTMYKHGKRYQRNVHRLVAEAAFNYYGICTDDLIVMHLDETRHNPRIDNLALGTMKENMNFPKCKERISKALKGKRLSDELKRKLSESHKNMSQETRRKLSEAHKGYHHSEESRKKMSEAHKGYHHSEESRRKISDAKKGKHHSAEARKKMSEAKPKKPVAAYKGGILIMTFPSVREASRNGYDRACIIWCCNGKLKTHRGFVWRYLKS